MRDQAEQAGPVRSFILFARFKWYEFREKEWGGSFNMGNTIPDGEEHQSNPAFYAEFSKQFIAVSIDRSWAQAHFLCNLLIGHFGTNQFQEFDVFCFQVMFLYRVSIFGVFGGMYQVAGDNVGIIIACGSNSFNGRF